MSRRIAALLIPAMALLLLSFGSRKKNVKVYLVGDSTVADYTLEKEYATKLFPKTGWGQVFQPLLAPDSLGQVHHIIKGSQALVDDRARGGRSSRTFFEEGRWSEVYRLLRKDDVVMIQFGHNDASVDKPERYVNIQGYKEYLRLFVQEAREKGAIPILLTPVARNYPWKDGQLGNAHGDYPDAMIAVAQELHVPLIDLNRLSRTDFTAKGEAFVSSHYFMNLPAGKYVAYPEGLKDNTHFQPEGAAEVARLVFEGMKGLDSAGGSNRGHHGRDR